MEENIEELAHQILFDFKNSISQPLPSMLSSSISSGMVSLKRQKSCSSPVNCFSGVPSPSSTCQSPSDVPYVPTSPIHSFLKLQHEDSNLVFGGNGDNLYNNNNNNSNSSNNNQPPLPTMFSTGKNLIPVPVSMASSLCNSTDSLHSDSILMFPSSPSQSVPSSPPSYGKSYKHNNTNNTNNSTTTSASTTGASLKNLSLHQHHPIHNYLNSIFTSSSSSTTSPIVSTNQQQQPTNNNVQSKKSTTNTKTKIVSSTNNNNNNNIICSLNDCLLCSRGQPEILIKNPTWASIMRVVFYTLHQEKDKPFFSLKSDVYDFMTSHWESLCKNKKRSDNWHKQIQDMLSHSKNIFESGMDKYKQNGFWRLKHIVDPWILPQKGSNNINNNNNNNNQINNRKSTSPISTPSNSLSSSPSSFTVPSIINSPLMLSTSQPSFPTTPLHHPRITRLFIDELHNNQPLQNRKRSSIDMLISTSYNDADLEVDDITSSSSSSGSSSPSSPRKKRLSDSGEVKQYCDNDEDENDQEDELFIDDSK